MIQFLCGYVHEASHVLLQSAAQLKNTYGAVWEGVLPSAPPLDLLISSSGQQLMLRYAAFACTQSSSTPLMHARP